MPYGNCGWGTNAGWGLWLFGALLLIGLVLLIVVAIRLLSRGPSGLGGHLATGPGYYPGPPSAPGGPGGARGILDERYARGEIDAEEYRERRRTLEGTD
ncbi:SHOCT domain-containing protein [Rhodococcus phenolicus]|uniref:SHOCT domain-containing protein n=1 Tax=Rhodococcus phenolicus TaxID=263849 RepID=UPI000832EF5F|nr:SHOCT domain-containing protein [Rhodococcus phenolicus]